jgi:hypothetical protein
MNEGISGYDKAFVGVCADGKSITEKALEKAHDIRKFEIELYWKRATYFWTLMGATLVAYGVLLGLKTGGTEFVLTSWQKWLILTGDALLGHIAAASLFFVNKGSKFWQRNWEMHVSLLENQVTGPLYKTVISEEKDNPWGIKGAYPYSVSALSTTLSATFAIFFFSLAAFSSGVFGSYIRLELVADSKDLSNPWGWGPACILAILSMTTLCIFISEACTMKFVNGTKRESKTESGLQISRRTINPPDALGSQGEIDPKEKDIAAAIKAHFG